jgi:hypothetical protein
MGAKLVTMTAVTIKNVPMSAVKISEARVAVL